MLWRFFWIIRVEKKILEKFIIDFFIVSECSNYFLIYFRVLFIHHDRKRLQ